MKRFLKSALKKPGKTIVFMSSPVLLISNLQSTGINKVQSSGLSIGQIRSAGDATGDRALLNAVSILEKLLGTATCGSKGSRVFYDPLPGKHDPAIPSFVGGGAPAASLIDISKIPTEVTILNIVGTPVLYAFGDIGLDVYLQSIGKKIEDGVFIKTYNEAVSGKRQKLFSPLISSLAENVGSQLFVPSYVAINNLDAANPIQALYGDEHYPHYWIKGITEEAVDAIDPAGIANAESIPKLYQYIYGIDIDPATLPYFELKRTP
jgi:hypothetical protein